MTQGPVRNGQLLPRLALRVLRLDCLDLLTSCFEDLSALRSLKEVSDIETKLTLTRYENGEERVFEQGKYHVEPVDESISVDDQVSRPDDDKNLIMQDTVLISSFRFGLNRAQEFGSE